ncbi:MAG: VF530 family DNA-binding protein [Opitutaceae bacterium]
MDSPQSKDPLHGVTLKQLLMELVEEFGWAELAERIDIPLSVRPPALWHLLSSR